MHARVTNSRESVSRGVARWGSLVAAGVFLVAFVADDRKEWPLTAWQISQAGLIATVFVAYVIAWRRGAEFFGGSVALVTTALAYAVCTAGGDTDKLYGLPLLAIGLPAVFYLVAATERVARRRRAAHDLGAA